MTAPPGVIWHTYPLGLLGADLSGARRTPTRTLADLVDWLPHLADLGADTLLLGPIFASLSHGYDTVDHRRIDDRIGDQRNFDTLIAAAAAQGIGVVLDGAFAYASRRFWRLDDVDEADDPWFERDADGALVPWRVDALVTPRYDAPAYRDYVAEVMTTWLDRGIAGWRLDSAWSVPAGFWRPVLARVRQSHPTAWLMAQVFDDDLPTVINTVGYTTATEYALMHAVRAWLGGGPGDDLAAALRLHTHNSSRQPVQTFVGNHDFARLADVVGPPLRPLAFALLMTVPGVPSIYYGDELGLTSTWTAGGGDAVLRPALVPDDAAATSARTLSTTVGELVALRRSVPGLSHGRLDDIRVGPDWVRYRVVTPTGGSLSVAVNGADHPVDADAVIVPAHGWMTSTT